MLEDARGKGPGVEISGHALFTFLLSICSLPLWERILGWMHLWSDPLNISYYVDSWIVTEPCVGVERAICPCPQGTKASSVAVPCQLYSPNLPRGAGQEAMLCHIRHIHWPVAEHFTRRQQYHHLTGRELRQRETKSLAHGHSGRL